MNTDTGNPAPASIVGIALDMTTTQALELAGGIAFTAGVLRDDLGAAHDMPEETRNLLYGSLCLIAHAARMLTEFVGEIDAQRGAAMCKPTNAKERAQEMLWHVADTLSFLHEVSTTITDEGWKLSQSDREGLARILEQRKEKTVEVIGELSIREDSHHA